MAELRAGAPDIAALVDDERLTLEADLTELLALTSPRRSSGECQLYRPTAIADTIRGNTT
jgi:hypothetical protein